MGKTKIEWTDESWNCIRGCSRVSQGCVHCYAERQAARFDGPGQPYEGLLRVVGNQRQWNGKIMVVEKHMADPLRWQRPRMVFVNSMSDLFHENLDFRDLAAIYGIMALSPRHTFQILTKRPKRAAEFFAWLGAMKGHDMHTGESYIAPTNPLMGCIMQADRMLRNETKSVRKTFMANYQGSLSWPPKNVWLGVSVEDQLTADDRIPKLLELPAAVFFLSCEPLLGPINLAQARGLTAAPKTLTMLWPPLIDWVIVGGESGPGARPMHPDWARSIREQCLDGGPAFFFKQWGAWSPERYEGTEIVDGGPGTHPYCMVRVGKKIAGRELDGRTWNEMPGDQIPKAKTA